MKRNQLTKEEIELSLALILIRVMQNRTNCFSREFQRKIKEEYGYDIRGGANHE